MKRRKKMTRIVVTILMCLAVISSANAYLFDGQNVNVEYWAGSGNNEALMQVQFGHKDNLFTFGYRWNDGEAQYGDDMIKAIAAAGGLDVVIVKGFYGDYVDGISYGSFNMAGYGGGENWWHYWVNNPGSDWEMPWTYGSSSRTLVNGCWDGWVYGTYNAPGVPEPNSLTALCSLMGLAASAKLLRFRRK